MNEKNRLYELTSREQDIARLMVSGLKAREIAEELILSYHYVRSCIRDMYSKLHVHSFKEAVEKIESLSLLHDEHPNSANHKHNFVTLSNQLIGRQAELDQLSQLLTEDGTRLVTLLGPGGIGKTRLALELGWRIWQQFVDGAFFVNLQAQRTGKDILSSIIDTLPLQSQANDPQTQLQTYLRARHMLLILDNFEHLSSGIEEVRSLLATAPQLRIVITSRKALNIIDERIYPILGLRFSSEIQVSNTLDFPSVQLFAERAQRVRANFSVENEVDSILEICQTVEGLPLALEIAASWTKVASCKSIAAEIKNSLDFLASRFADSPPRHQSIRAVFDHSWSMLTPHEKKIFPRLSVFKDGFTREAAQIVAGATWADLAGLIEKSLIRMAQPERYSMHELLRQYAEEQLNNQQADAHIEHCTYFMNFMIDREADIKGRRQLPALDEIEVDFENIRTAWLHAIEQQDLVALDAMLESFFWFCYFRIRIIQGREMLQQALGAVDAEKYPLLSVQIRSRYTRLSTDFWSHPVDKRDEHLATLRDLLDPCWDILQQHNSPADRAFCELIQGKIEQDGVQADVHNQHPDGYHFALQSMEQSIRIYSEIDDIFYLSLAKFKIAWLYLLYARHDESLSAIYKSLELCQKIDNIILADRALFFIIAFDTTAKGHYDLALTQAREARHTSEQSGDLLNLIYCGQILCDILFKLGRFSEVQQTARRMLPIAKDINDNLKEAFFLHYFSLTFSMKEDYIRALQYANDCRPLVGDVITWERTIVHHPLAIIACGQNDFVSLKHYLTVLLTIASSDLKGEPGHLIEYLPLTLFWLVHEGQLEYSVSIMGLMETHSAESTVRWAKKWSPYQRLCQHLQDELHTVEFQSAYQQGAELNLREVVETILNEVTK